MDDLIPIIGILAVFGLPTLLVLGIVRMREQTKQSAHKLLSEALARGEKLDPALLKQLADFKPAEADRPRKTLGSAIVMLALAVGFVGASYFSGEFDPTGYSDSGLVTAAMILGALGLGFLALALVDYANKKKSDAA